MRVSLAQFILPSMTSCPVCTDLTTIRSVPHRQHWDAPDPYLAFEYEHRQGDVAVRITACAINTNKGVFYGFRTHGLRFTDPVPILEELYVQAMLESAVPQTAPMAAWAYGDFRST